MTIDEVKAKLAESLGKTIEDVVVTVDPREGGDFTLKLTAGAVAFLGTSELVALLDLGKEAVMDVLVNPQTDDTLWVTLKKEPVTITF